MSPIPGGYNQLSRTADRLGAICLQLSVRNCSLQTACKLQVECQHWLLPSKTTSNLEAASKIKSKPESKLWAGPTRSACARSLLVAAVTLSATFVIARGTGPPDLSARVQTTTTDLLTLVQALAFQRTVRKDLVDRRRTAAIVALQLFDLGFRRSES